MDNPKPNSFGEINLKNLIKKIFDRKFYFLASMIVCGAIAYGYIKTAIPVYEVSTSLLIDPSGKNRELGDSKYVDGGVGLIGAEKNLYNEIAILKSYSLIEQAIKELDFRVSYFTKPNFNFKEHYGYFPFEVELSENAPLLFGEKFNIKPLDENRFQLSVESEKFTVSNPENNTTHEIKKPLNFKKAFNFDESIEHEYFSFKVKKPTYKINLADFEDQDLFFQINSIASLANEYHEKLKVEQVDIQASILTLGVTGVSPDKEVTFLEGLSSSFINRKLYERNEIAASKESFIRTQLKEIADSLSKAEKSLENFKRGASAVDLTKSSSLALDQLQTLETDKGQMSFNVQYYQSLLDYLNDPNAVNKIVSPSAAGINDPILSDNIMELKRLYGEKTRLEFYKGAKSYDLVLINEQITNSANSLKENIRNLIRSEELKLKDRNQRIARLESNINQLPVNEKKLLNFQRESTLYGNMYNYLNQELTKTGIARAEDISDTKVIDKPRQLGEGPVAPQKILILLLAAIIGFLLPLLGIIFADSSIETILQANQIEQYSTISLLSQVEVFNSSLSTLANYKSDWDKDETFRSLSANLQYRVPDEEQNVIGVTSTLKGEGKTFCALNLAANYAKAGKKTLLLDLNFRNPILAKGLEIQNTPELKDYLSDPSVTVEKITRQHPTVPNLNYIITKTAEQNSHKYLSNVRLNNMIKALKYEYDYIIIDTPAVGLVSDYLIIARHTDINLFIIRKGMAKVSHIDEVEKLIRKGKMNNPFLVFNGAFKKSNPAKNYTRSDQNGKANKLVKWPINFKKSVS